MHNLSFMSIGLSCFYMGKEMGRRVVSKSPRVQFLLSASLATVASSFSFPGTSMDTYVSRIEGQFCLNSRKFKSSRSMLSRSVRRMATKTNQVDEEQQILALDEWQDVLPFEKGSHNSAKLVIPSPEEEQGHFAASTFRKRLETTISACHALGKSSLWVYVPMSRSALIEDMVGTGLHFHHASGNIAVLNLWLRESASKIPEFATHNVGVGAVVINSRNEILCVRELRKNYLPWKTPTGLTELGESLDEAAIREVQEETGVATRFHSILSFRQTHDHAHGRSDMFFVCRLDPIEEINANNGNVIIPEPVAQECEIETAAWVPYAEYRDMVNDPERGHPMMQQVLKVMEARQMIDKTIVASVLPGREPNDVYFPTIDTEDRDL